MEERTLLEYWLLLYKRKWTIGLIVLSALCTSGILSMLLPAVYEAKAVFFIPQTPDTATFLTGHENMVKAPLVPEAKEDAHGPYIGILKSKTIAELIQQEYPHKKIIDLMIKDTDFVLTDEFLIEVYARDKDPQIAAGIANAYIRYFNQLMQGYPERLEIKMRESLERKIEDTQKQLLKTTTDREEFQRKNKTTSIDEETKHYISMKMTFKSKLDNIKIIYRENEGKINALIEQLDKEGALLNSAEFTVTSPLLENIQNQISDVEVKMAGLKAEVRESHPDLIGLNNQYIQLKEHLKKEIDRIVKSRIKAPNTFYESLRQQLVGLYVNKEALDASTNAYKAIIKDIDLEIEELPAIQTQWDRLSMEVDRNKKILDTLKTNLEELKAQEGKEMQTAVLVDKAAPPQSPSFPLLWLNLIVAGIAGVIAGIFYTFFLDYLKQTRRERIFKILRAIEATEKD